MQHFGVNPDIDGLIVSYLDPPQILTMSEVNSYFNQLAADRRAQFVKVKYDVSASLRERYEWIVQWHIRCISDSIDISVRRDICTYEYISRLVRKYIQSCYLFNSFSFTHFLMKNYTHVNCSGSNIYVFGIDDIFKGDVDIKFMKFVDDCLQRFCDTDLRRMCNMGISWSAGRYSVTHDLLKNKKYEEVLYFLDIIGENAATMAPYFSEGMEIWDRSNTPLDCTSDFLISFLRRLHMMQYVLKAACIMSTDQVFFELVDKYSDTISHSDLFFAACRGGHVSVAQWIRSDAVVKGRPIDLTVESVQPIIN